MVIRVDCEKIKKLFEIKNETEYDDCEVIQAYFNDDKKYFADRNISITVSTNKIEINKVKKEDAADTLVTLHTDLDKFETDVIDSITEGLSRRGYKCIRVTVGPGMKLSINAEKGDYVYGAYFG